MPSDQEFTIAELSALTDVPVRTIRYYIGQGLLPAPGREGPSTRYSDAVLARLRLIKRSRDRHLPLAAIRSELSALTDEDVVELAETPEHAPADSAIDYVRSLLVADGAPGVDAPAPGRRPLLRTYAEPPMAAPGTAAPPSAQVAPAPGPAAAPAPHGPPPPHGTPAPARARTATPTGVLRSADPASRPTPPPTPERSQWERIVLEPDIELHVRRPLSRPQNRRVERLLAFARELTEGDQP